MTRTHPTGSALLAAIVADPAEDAPRLIYADWLEENGQVERGEFLRRQVKNGEPFDPEAFARIQ